MAANMAADMEVDEVANKKEEKKGHAKKKKKGACNKPTTKNPLW